LEEIVQSTKSVILKPKKDKAIKNKHHWIFSGAIAELPPFEDGDILSVYSSNKEFLGKGYFNHKTSISGRMLTFDDQDPSEAILRNIDSAIFLRATLFDRQITNAFRLINGEGDFLPGLIVDQYHDVLVLQIATKGIEQLKSLIIEYLIKKLKPRVIYEKSTQPTRKEEGLKTVEYFHLGPEIEDVEILENGLRFIVPIKEGQKTGFFLDQREMRLLVKQLAKNKKVLNCFAYTGGFSVYAALGGAQATVSVDISEKAIALAKVNISLNELKVNNSCIKADVFHYLRENTLEHDLIILDPPAFAKKHADVVQACRGYKDINRLAMEKMPAKSLLLTCSCSYHVDESLFQKVVFQAAVEADRKVRIIERHRQAMDHPINLCHPEIDYLKSFLLYVE
jgi:23S rRNA (cytosine1962-C5)-methyltransferase